MARRASTPASGCVAAICHFHCARRIGRPGIGDLLIYDGDLVHAGSAYPTRQYDRMHIFIETPVMPEDKGQVFGVNTRGLKQPPSPQPGYLAGDLGIAAT